jgi:polysaccharide export outer membrane protein
MAYLLLALLLTGSTAAAQTAQTGAAPAAPPAQTERVTPSSDNRDYVVGPQDVLKITVFDEAQLTGMFRVDNDGAFQYPFIGRVTAAGRTLREIEGELTKRLAEGYVKRPQVALEVDQYRSRSLFIVGEVRTPGKYPLTGQMTLIEALAQAGYTTPSAGSDVLILRSASADAAGRELTPEQATQTTRINLTELQAGRTTSNIVLKEGDTIFVPKAEKFYVSGFVKAPGAYSFERGMTVLQALSLAGGVSEKGSNRRVRVQRVVNGQKKELDVKLTDLVQPNDTIIVRQRLL